MINVNGGKDHPKELGKQDEREWTVLLIQDRMSIVILVNYSPCELCAN